MKPLSLAIGLLGTLLLSYECRAQIRDDPFSQYLERSYTVTLGAGNAKDANIAIQTIDPWPPYVGNTRIPGDGRRAVNSIEQMYRIPNPFVRQQTGAGASTLGGAATGLGVGTNPGTGTSVGTNVGTPMQPITSGN